MQDTTRAVPRMMTAAAIALVVVALAAFAYLAGGATAGAAGTEAGGTAPSGQTLPVQSDRDGDGTPCPEVEGGSGSSGEQDAPGTATPETAL